MTPERMDLWYADKRKPITEHGKTKLEMSVIHITPTFPVTRQSIQKDVVNALRSILNVAESYYVVMVVRKADGELGYRTFIPKTLV